MSSSPNYMPDENKKEYCPKCGKMVNVRIITFGPYHWIIECAECGELLLED